MDVEAQNNDKRRDDILQELRSVMARLLSNEPSVQDLQVPLIELGANSLTLMEFVRAVEKRYGLKVPIRSFFEELLSIE